MLILLIMIYLLLKFNRPELCRKDTNIEKFTYTKRKNWAILLTTAINVNNQNQYRKILYEQQIKKWLSNTSFDIFVIESTNLGFPDIPKHPRLKIITIDIPNDNRSLTSSITESYSILHALEHIPSVYNYILKVTGRYYLENIENVWLLFAVIWGCA